MKNIKYCGGCSKYKVTHTNVTKPGTRGECTSKKPGRVTTGSRSKACKNYKRWWQFWK